MEVAMLNKEAFIVGNIISTFVCRECARLSGPVRTNDGEKYDQKCGCERAPSEKRWHRFDFNTAVDLCHACTATLIPSGSRWFPFYCATCLHLVEAENIRLPRTSYIPIGRHSLMHGIGHARESGTAENTASAEFTEAFDDLRARIERLQRIHVSRVRAVFEYLAAAERIPTATFLLQACATYTAATALSELTREFVEHGPPPHPVDLAQFTDARLRR